MYRLFFVLRVTAFLLVSLSFFTQGLFAQAPAIKYTTPHKYKINDPIPSLAPTNTGGAVPAAIYGQVSTIAGSLTVSIFFKVTGVAVDPAGNVFVADWGDNTIFKLSPSGNLSTFAGHSFPGLTDGQGTAAAFNAPDALVLDAAGNLYVSDQQNSAIRKITPGGFVSTLAETGSEARFNNPRGLAIDNAGNLYVADQGNNVIKKITAAGVVTTYAGNGIVGADNGPVASASFNSPTAVGLDAAGNLYVSDAGNSAIRKITPTGVVSTFATGFNFPRELRVDGTGNVYVAEQYGNTIKKISPNGDVTIIAGGGKKDANGVTATFDGPIGLTMDGKGNLFVGESSLVRKITLTGYTIDKPLPAGMTFDPKTGIISGTPTVLSPPTVYTVTASNGTGNNSTTLSIEVVQDITLLPSVITFPVPEVVNMSIDNILHPGATSTNTNAETPITYTSSNPDVAYVGADGQIHIVAPGKTNITANQAANDEYLAAAPVSRTFTITQDQLITFPAIAAKTTCDIDFPAGATSSNGTIPLTYASSNPAVATVSATGVIHIIAAGSTTITASQSGNDLYNAATLKSQTLTVTAPVAPSVSISPPGLWAGCDGMEVTYTADAQNAGSNATYQWMVNGQNSGDHSKTFTSSTLHTGDIITCVVTNNDGCEPVTSPVSNEATIEADPYVTLSLTITSSVSGTIIAGTQVTFKAASPNTLDNPIYQWQVNGQNVGDNSSTFKSNTLSDGDVVSCTMVSGGKCIANPSVNSNAITVSVIVPEKIVVPNTFTPNGDGYNDTWYIPGLLSYTNCTINIYNRYGAMMYRSVGYQHPWDGTSNGKTVPSGVYYYVIDTKSSSGKLSGEVTLLR